MGSDIKNFPGEKVVIITDQGIKKSGILDYVKGIIKDFNFVIFDEVEADPSLETFKKAVAFVKENDSEIFIGLGGGSPIDVAKVISVIAKYGGDVKIILHLPLVKGNRLLVQVIL